MNDKELLELSAKAAKAEVIGCDERKGLWIKNRFMAWNPLTDDGDALRLAVKLKIIPACDDIQASAMASLDKSSWCTLKEVNGDRYAATRRAIVRAAAEIGKSL
jgi:hypothetical protein